MVAMERNANTDWTLGLKFDHQIWPWPWPWPWIFKVKYQIFYINQKLADCHETKSKHIDWILGLKCDHWVWPWLWPWPWIFRVKFWKSHISGIGGPIDIEQKGFFRDHDRDLLVTKRRCKDLSKRPVCLQMLVCHRLIIPPASTKLKWGYTGFTLSVRLSVCGQNRVRPVSSTILVESISYLHILSCNFRRCVMCNVCFKIQKFEILSNSLNL